MKTLHIYMRLVFLGLSLLSCQKSQVEPIHQPPTHFASSPVSVLFDYSDPKLIGLDPLDRPVYLINQIGFSENNLINYGYAYSNLDEDFSNGRIIKTEKVNSNLYVITYFGENFEPIGSITIGPNNQMDFSFAGWGDDTMECLEDAYSNHGWISVWATIQTAFIPQTGVALSLACAIINL